MTVIKASRHNVPGRPIAAVVGLDAAYSGPAGLSVLARKPDGAVFLAGWRTGSLREVGTYRWLGDVLGGSEAVCRPGERVVLVAESDAFGGMAVARKLGRGVGAIEGLLLDLNATDPDSTVDVTTTTWRTAIRLADGRGCPKGIGRVVAKQRAIEFVEERYGVAGMPVDAAEATCIATWWSDRDIAQAAERGRTAWGLHSRPVPCTPTGLRRGR